MMDAERRGMRLRRSQTESGLTIVELMVSMALGMFVVIAATVLLVSSKSAYVMQDEEARLQETGRYALGVIARAIHQAGYENWDKDDASLQASVEYSPGIIGLDAKSLKESSNGIESPVNASINGSDVLALRFFGSGTGEHGDGTVLNCAGFGVPASALPADADEGRGWSIFYVAKGVDGEPELYCKYRGKKAWSTGAIATGVESFQVLYGIDSDGDGVPNTYLTATAIDALDDALVPAESDTANQALDVNRRSHWKKIVAVKVALLLRAARSGGAAAAKAQYDLFGKDYADANAASDSGTRVREADLPAAARNRLRRIFVQTIQVHNRMAGGRA
jgi:type IV pilus assembly protein PilW